MISLFATPLACCLALVGPVAALAQQTSLTSDHFRASAGSVPPASAPTAVTSLTPELRGDIYMARKMYREAIDVYRQGSPSSPILTNKIGIAFHQLLQLDLAKKNYERAVKLDPKYPEAINNLGTIYYAQKSYRRAIGYYKRALRYTNPTASIYANLGAAYFGRKDYKHASECYEEALKLDPEVFEHHSGYGTLMQERTIDERATFHLYLAKFYAKSGARDRALLYLRKALEEGIKNREKIPAMPEFTLLKTDPDFQQLLADNPKPL